MSSLLKGMKTAGNLPSPEYQGLWDILREHCTMSTAGVAAQEMRVPLKTGFLHTSQGMGSLKTCWSTHSGFEKWVRLKFICFIFKSMKWVLQILVPVQTYGSFTAKAFFFFLFSTFFNVDPIAVTYNLNPSTEQRLPSLGKYRVWHSRVRKCQGFVSGKAPRASLTPPRSRLRRAAPCWQLREVRPFRSKRQNRSSVTWSS